jgi:5-formaminoimidazole-4-carboxamide-1-(beta)-D-ribofuranosyl 5'-monophosphate synthetase
VTLYFLSLYGVALKKQISDSYNEVDYRIMIALEKMRNTAKAYKAGKLHIGVLGSHSALAMGMAAKAFGAKTLLVVEKGRDALYTREHSHLYDHVIIVEKFRDILKPEIQSDLLNYHTVWIPHRSFSVYVGVDGIEEEFQIPVYGNRRMLRTEDRNTLRSQYYFLEKAEIRFPKQFKKPEEIDRVVLVKVQRADKPLERAFFYANSPEQYYKQAELYKAQGLIDDEALKKARIEEYVFGSRVNANWQAYALKDIFGDLDLIGFSDRRQVNLQGFLQLPAQQQLQLNIPVTNEEVGHYGITMRESLHPLFWDAARKFIETVKHEEPPGMVGPFGLQGAVAYAPDDPRKLEFVVFDVSPRIPGDPAIGPTSPEMRNLTIKFQELLMSKYKGRQINDPLDLVVLEILEAADRGRLSEVVT